MSRGGFAQLRSSLSVVPAGLLAAALGTHAVAATPAATAATPCAIGTYQPVLQPVFAGVVIQNDQAVDCAMWQTFIYLTWPADPLQRGVPRTTGGYGSGGAAVWDTFKSYDEVFLPNGQVPPGWNDDSQLLSKLRLSGQKKNAVAGQRPLKLLSSRSEVFRPLVAERNAAVGQPGKLEEIKQVGGGVLYDQATQPVYYEMLLDKTEFDYIFSNQLYNATTQNTFAKDSGLALPVSSIEVKAAWKVLTPAELGAKPVRFYTAQAILPGTSNPVTVGLVGLHVVQMPSANAFYEGFWATFAQVDNAPVQGQTIPSGAQYSFNNPACTACAPNTKSTKPAPTQVVQQFAVAPTAKPINEYAQSMIASQAPDSPWQFYQLLEVQWPTSAIPIGKPGATAPLAQNATMNTVTSINPVLETFLQQPNTSCFGCHTYASTAKSGGASSFASSFSFLFGHAQAPSGK